MLGHATGAIAFEARTPMQDVDAQLLSQLLASAVNQRRLKLDDLGRTGRTRNGNAPPAPTGSYTSRLCFRTGLKVLIHQSHLFEQFSVTS